MYGPYVSIIPWSLVGRVEVEGGNYLTVRVVGVSTCVLVGQAFWIEWQHCLGLLLG